MSSLPASTSCGGAAISSVVPPTRLRHRHHISKLKGISMQINFQKTCTGCPSLASALKSHSVLELSVSSLSLFSFVLFSCPFASQLHYDDKAAEAGQGFWNCPCVPMRERKECHCMLFLTPENDVAGQEQTISLEDIRESTANMYSVFMVQTISLLALTTWVLVCKSLSTLGVKEGTERIFVSALYIMHFYHMHYDCLSDLGPCQAGPFPSLMKESTTCNTRACSRAGLPLFLVDDSHYRSEEKRLDQQKGYNKPSAPRIKPARVVQRFHQLDP
ncbi:hypothetical protein RHSIM_Rhsim08G0061500 [Rhododendron simsii]|uniref:Ferredoxin-thioredoxin reductase catalytic chain, chloroplastic n=1 Tax=Rhododendron simsii TaxID=118357 RepID=A0A834LGE5_RHOSS|nr:hypothetical protein RHSIM_Rhsim08G0061500 [Rhododendron simsii]